MLQWSPESGVQLGARFTGEARVQDPPETVEVGIVIPAYNAARTLPQVVVAALRAACEAEVVVVDAGSTDGSGRLASRLGARVIRHPERIGPAAARNIGAAQVSADVVLFLDADCVPHSDVVKRVSAAFSEDPELTSLTGSYDAHPPEKGFFSQYMNLRHHFTHQVARREKATFWAGCGAVRRMAFQAAGGFDAERYPDPQIEDIELGTRLAEQGATRLDPELQVTHLKRWTLRSVVATDVFRRALPWSQLILNQGSLPNDLNLRGSQRLAALLAPLTLLSLATLPSAALAGAEWAIALALAIVSASIGLNAGMLRVFARERGVAFAAGAWLFHQVHLLYSAATFAICALIHRLRVRVPS
jgi:GT2 family glycosyltransferase